MLQTLVMPVARKPIRLVRNFRLEGYGCNVGLVGSAVSKKPTRMLEAHGFLFSFFILILLLILILFSHASSSSLDQVDH